MKCPKCSGSWEAPEGTVIETCPFCQHNLKPEAKPNLNTPEGILQKIVTDFTQEIFQDPKKFSSLLADYFVHDKKMLKILTTVLEHGGAKEILAFSNQAQGDFELNRRKLILKIADDTLIPSETIEIGVNLLCEGLGKSGETTFTEKTPPPEPPPSTPEVQLSPKEPQPQEQVSAPKPQASNVPPTPQKKAPAKTLEESLEEAKQQKSVELPSHLLSVPARQFKNNTLIEKVRVNGETNTIEKSAFEGCSNLEEVIFSDSLSTIEEYAFAGCSLKELHLPTMDTIPPHYYVIEDFAFTRNYQLKEVFIPKNVSTVQAYAFANCTALEKVVVESPDTKIDSTAFYETPWQKQETIKKEYEAKRKKKAKPTPPPEKKGNLPKATSPSPPTTGKKYSFSIEQTKELLQAYQNKAHVLIPEGITVVPEEAFMNNHCIESVWFPDTVTEIQARAFGYCRNLKEVTLPKTLQKLGVGAFGSTDLRKIHLPEGLSIINHGVFTSCQNLEEIKLPSNVTGIGVGAFYRCNFRNIEIPSSVTVIGKEAFMENSSLFEVFIPASVTSMGERAFQDCRNLTFVELENPFAGYPKDAFKGTLWNKPSSKISRLFDSF